MLCVCACCLHSGDRRQAVTVEREKTVQRYDNFWRLPATAGSWRVPARNGVLVTSDDGGAGRERSCPHHHPW